MAYEKPAQKSRFDGMVAPAGGGFAAALGEERSLGSVQLQAQDVRAVIAQREAADAWHGSGVAEPAGSGESAKDVAVRGTRSSATTLPYVDRIQQSFGGYDIGNVQAHLGSSASQAATALRAEAYATGNHVVFSGQPSLRTAAHEAAHVVQQKAGLSLPGGFGQQGDPYEKHADQVADLVVQGRSAESVLSRFAPASALAEHSSSVQKQESAVAVQLDPSKWDKATYDSAQACMNDHFSRHPGPWGDTAAYTTAALKHYDDNQDKATPHTLRDGSQGVKIRTSSYFGIYTSSGKIVTFGVR